MTLKSDIHQCPVHATLTPLSFRCSTIVSFLVVRYHTLSFYLRRYMQRRLLLIAAVVLPVAVAISYSYSTSLSTSSTMSTAAIVPTATPLSFVLFGATGRTGLPFMHQALARGHRITAFSRSANKVPVELAANPNLTTVEVELDQSDKITAAMAAARPDVVYVMLASDPSPHTAVSTGTRSALTALRSMREAAATTTASTKATPLIVITGWGMEPTRPSLRWYERAFVSLAVNTFYAPVARDFTRTVALLEAATADGLIQSIQLMPPLLTNGALTATYEYGDALGAMKGKMHTFDSVSRASMANVAMLVGEKVAAGQTVPGYIALRQP